MSKIALGLHRPTYFEFRKTPPFRKDKVLNRRGEDTVEKGRERRTVRFGHKRIGLN